MCACNNSTNNTSEITSKNTIFTDEDYFDYGIIKEGDSVIYHTFVIKNGTTDTHFIDHIESSCGCTKVFTDCDSIAPGEMCEIKTEIKTAGYLGNIIREINVFIVGIEEPLTFSVAAYIPMPIQAIKAKYSKEISKNVYTSYNVINIGNVYKNSNSYGYTELVNMSNKTIQIKTHTDSRLVTLDNIEELKPLIPARLYVYYDNSSIKSWGVDTTIVYVDVENISVPIKCVANILPFPKGKNTKMSPRILNNSTEIRNPNMDFFSFKFRNIGAEPLKIIDYKTSKNVVITKFDETVEPSQNGEIKCKKLNNGNGYIDILTNDPLSPIVRYRIIAN